jgi:hypothetical protein
MVVQLYNCIARQLHNAQKTSRSLSSEDIGISRIASIVKFQHASLRIWLHHQLRLHSSPHGLRLTRCRAHTQHRSRAVQSLHHTRCRQASEPSEHCELPLASPLSPESTHHKVVFLFSIRGPRRFTGPLWRLLYNPSSYLTSSHGRCIASSFLGAPYSHTFMSCLPLLPDLSYHFGNSNLKVTPGKLTAIRVTTYFLQRSTLPSDDSRFCIS